MADTPGNAKAAGFSMGRTKSVTTFFVTSVGLGKGGDLGGLAGADAHCEELAQAQGAGDRTWRAYLSTSPTNGSPAINARDRIGKGPWHNAAGYLIADNVDHLHGVMSGLTPETVETEEDGLLSEEDGSAGKAILTGSRADGTAFVAEDRTCGNWTSSSNSGAAGFGAPLSAGASWNASGTTKGCGQTDLAASGSGGRFYCFAAD